MDVKVGSGAFMETIEQARALAAGLRGVAAALKRPVRTLLTDMSQPLGRMVGNAVEVRESIDCLRGGGPADVRELTIELCAEMIVLREGQPGDDLSLAAARERAVLELDSGRAMEKFCAIVSAQGGDVSAVESPERLPTASHVDEFRCREDGFITAMDCREIGLAALELGAGRNKTTDSVDHSVGLEVLVRIGDRVQTGQPLIRIMHARRGVEACRARLDNAFTVENHAREAIPLVLERA